MRTNTVKHVGTKIGHFTPHKNVKLNDFTLKIVKTTLDITPLISDIQPKRQRQRGIKIQGRNIRSCDYE